MTTHAPPVHASPTHDDKRSYDSRPGRIHFLLRRVHSLLGIIFGGYIAVHLTVNASGFSPAAYQGYVNHIHNLEPALPLIEIVTIFIPLLFHAVYGAYIAWSGVKFNTLKYNYFGNLRYSLQRWTAWILLLFIAFHVGTLHKWGLIGIHNVLEHVDKLPDPMPANAKLDAIQRFSSWCQDNGGMFSPENAYQSTVSGVRNMFYDSDHPDAVGYKNILVMAFYLLGIWCATFHFANGLWTAAIAWGLTTTAQAQKRWGHVCFGFFLVLTMIGTAAWLAFTAFANTNYSLPTS